MFFKNIHMDKPRLLNFSTFELDLHEQKNSVLESNLRVSMSMGRQRNISKFYVSCCQSPSISLTWGYTNPEKVLIKL